MTPYRDGEPASSGSPSVQTHLEATQMLVPPPAPAQVFIQPIYVPVQVAAQAPQRPDVLATLLGRAAYAIVGAVIAVLVFSPGRTSSAKQTAGSSRAYLPPFPASALPRSSALPVPARTVDSAWRPAPRDSANVDSLIRPAGPVLVRSVDRISFIELPNANATPTVTVVNTSTCAGTLRLVDSQGRIASMVIQAGGQASVRVPAGRYSAAIQPADGSIAGSRGDATFGAFHAYRARIAVGSPSTIPNPFHMGD